MTLHPEIFRRQCVHLALQRCPSLYERTAHELGISEETLTTWVDELGGDKLSEQCADAQRGICPGAKAQFERLEALKVENDSLHQEISDLNKAMQTLRGDNQHMSRIDRTNQGLRRYTQALLRDNIALRALVHEPLGIGDVESED